MGPGQCARRLLVQGGGTEDDKGPFARLLGRA